VNDIDDRMVGIVHSGRLPEAARGPVVVLVGVPGAGKSTVGTALAERLGVGFRDTDTDVESTTRRAIADIFVQSGEAEFRRLEAAAVATALAEHDGVLALGGGAVIDSETRALLAGLPVVWLRVGLAAASQRAGLSGARPVLLGNVRSQMKALMDARAPLYTEVARLTVDTEGMTVEESVEAIVAGLGLGATAVGRPAVEAGLAVGEPPLEPDPGRTTDSGDLARTPPTLPANADARQDAEVPR
jgi:shikimate kinase